MIPHVQGLHEKFADKGLLVFAPHVQSADRETLEMFLLKRGATYPVAVKSNTSDYPGSGIPRGAIIGVNGKIIWEGHPGSSQCDEIIEEELKKVDMYGERLIAKTQKSIVKSILTGKLGAAYAAMQKPVEGTPDAGVLAVQGRLESKAKAMLARAEAMVAAGDYFGAKDKYTDVEKLFKGCEFAETAAAAKKAIDAKEDFKAVKQAYGVWQQIVAKASKKKKDAIGLAAMLTGNPKLAETYYGKQADKVARLLDSVK
jgi:hypothetical protein